MSEAKKGDEAEALMASVMREIADEKKQYLARDEVYPHLKKIVDALLEVKGVAYIAAHKHGIERTKIWEWVKAQLG